MLRVSEVDQPVDLAYVRVVGTRAAPLPQVPSGRSHRPVALSRTWTKTAATVRSSVAVPASVVGEATVAPAAGAVIVALAGVVSGVPSTLAALTT